MTASSSEPGTAQTATDAGAERRQGARYDVSAAEIEAFHRDGYVHLRGVMSTDEMAEIEAVYERFLRGEIAVEGKDFNDMTTGEHGTDPRGYAVVNVMLPRRYHPAWQGNLFELRAMSIAAQLCGEGMVIDFDQLLAKSPGRPDAVFHWHQDQAYWIDTDDRRTATCWLAVDDSTLSPQKVLHQLRIHLPPPGFTVDQHRVCPGVADGVGGGNEGQCGNQNFVIGPNAGNQQCGMQCGSSVDSGHGVFHARVVGHALFKAIDEFTDG